MPESQMLVFESYRLDLSREQLWRGQETIQLTNKAFAVLRYLVEHADQLITRDALMEAVWPGVFVSDAALTVCIHELRQALGETAQAPRFIETVRGRGYRFLELVTAPTPTRHESLQPSNPRAVSSAIPSDGLVGREVELRQLQESFAIARQGKRQVVFITGEAGIGKTTLVEAFIDQITIDETVWVGYGQCIEHYGAGEAYLPLLEALGRLCRTSDGQMLVELLRQEAPSWLLQMPALLSSDEFDALQRRGGGATRERMLRELAETLERLTAERSFVLVLEDLHWSDRATLDWLAYIARRRDRARLLVLGTYRPVETIVQAHPLRTVTQELKRHRQCWELLLDYLSEAGVAAYVRQRFGEKALSPEFSRVLHQQSNGNPLFMIALVEDMMHRGRLEEGSQGWLLRDALDTVALDVPESLRQLIEAQLEQLSPLEQDILEAASVTGIDFSTAAVATGIDATEEEVDRYCVALSRRQQFLQEMGTTEWTDGTVAARYGFIHALYQEVLYNRVSAGRRVQLHGRIGARLEIGYGAQAREIATELAMHFLQARDIQRASHYLLAAGENALRRSAYPEAITHLKIGLDILSTCPDSTERAQREVQFHVALGRALMATKGQSNSEVGQVYARARELCQQLNAMPELFSVLMGLWLFYLARTEFVEADNIATRLLSLSQRQLSVAPQVDAYRAQGATLFYMGKIRAAHGYLEQGVTLYQSQPHHSDALLGAGVACLGFAAWVLWMVGYPDQALRRAHEALSLAQASSHPYHLSVSLFWLTWLYQCRREWELAQKRAEDLVDLAARQGFALFLAGAVAQRGSTLVVQGQPEIGSEQIRQGIADLQDTGLTVFQPYFRMYLAVADGKRGSSEAGVDRLREVLTQIHESGERWWEAELYRLQGELLLRQAVADIRRAETCFHQALNVARSQGTKSLECRAATSLAHLWQSQGKRQAAYDLLAPVYEWFTEGFDTADLREAKALLRELGG